MHALAGGGQRPQLPLGVGQHHPRLGHPEHRHAPLGQPAEELDGVVTLDQGVSQFHEGTRQQVLSSHDVLTSSPSDRLN
jgi:hypothetical protein